MRALTKQIINHFETNITIGFRETLEDVLTEIEDQEAEDMESLIESLQDIVDKEKEEKEMINETFDGKQRVETHVFTNSSMLDKVTYDKVAEDLTVWFKNNSQVSYLYHTVTEGEYQGLVEATSPGSWFSSEIKPFHTCTKVVNSDEEE
jgi:formate dehydrogenase maturation protein FdhE